MLTLGVILFASTVTVLVAEFLRKRTRSFPTYGWIGLACLAVAEPLMFRGIEPVATFFTPIAWTAYVLIADAAVLAIRGRSRLHDSPLRFARLALLSIPLWLIFEAYNLRLQNWIYVGGLRLSTVVTWLAYGWAFATIWPGIFLTADLVESFGWWDRPFRPIIFSRPLQGVFIIVGAVLLIVPVVLPAPIGSFLFAAVWVGFVFLLDPVNSRLGLPSFEREFARGRPGLFFSYFVSGWVCGWLWEFWNYWAAAKWNYVFPIMQNEKIFEMPAAGYLGFLPFALECFVMYYFAAWLLGWEKPVPEQTASQIQSSRSAAARLISRPLAVIPWILIGIIVSPRPAHASSVNVPDAARHGLTLLYSGHPKEAVAQFHELQTTDPASPLGYLLEAEARWWQIYCEACEVKWNTVDAWERPRLDADQAYLDLADRAISLSESRIAQSDSAEMQLYDAMGWMLRARLLGLRNDRRGTARAGINTRTHSLRCLELDPQMADAYTGLGLYNYYVDTLSPIARILRFFMGIPGGSKQDGIRQLETAMNQGDLLRVEARFYLAKNLRNYDHDYARSLEIFSPLIAEFPQNAIFQLLLGDIQAKLGHRDLAAGNFRQAQTISTSDTLCDQHIRALAGQSANVFAGVAPEH
jgi:tetratricopeptide (TPR) repeat protein